MNQSKHHFKCMHELEQLPTIRFISQWPKSDLGETVDFPYFIYETRQDEFASQCSFIYLAMFHFFPDCAIYISGNKHSPFKKKHSKLKPDVDISGKKIKLLDKLVREAAKENPTSISFYFYKVNICMYLSGADNAEISGNDPQFDELLKKIVTSQGLFLETYENIWTDAHWEAGLRAQKAALKEKSQETDTNNTQ